MAEELKLSNLGTIALSIGVAVISIVLITVILEEIRTKKSIVPDDIASHANETFSYANNTVINLLENRLVSGSEKVWNSSTLVLGNVNGTGNYSMEYGSDGVRAFIRLYNVSPCNGDSTCWNHTNATWSISYDYYYGSSARNATGKGIESQVTIASFLEIVSLVAAGAIIIGIVLVALMRRNEEY